MLVTKFIEIDMGHRVPNHKSKCRNLHGHRYKIEVGVDDKVLTERGTSDEGMVIDFSDLKAVMMKEIDEVYDHAFTISEYDTFVPFFRQAVADHQLRVNFVPFVPTAENLAELWYMIMEQKLKEKGIKIKFVRVWETPTSTATYEKQYGR